jgi:hypothetical protein
VIVDCELMHPGVAPEAATMAAAPVAFKKVRRLISLSGNFFPHLPVIAKPSDDKAVLGI